MAKRKSNHFSSKLAQIDLLEDQLFQLFTASRMALTQIRFFSMKSLSLLVILGAANVARVSVTT